MSDALANPRRLHLGLAEQGKLHALAGRFRQALAYYREAMRMAVERGEPEVYFRHYLECSLEALEQMGAFAEVAACCERSIEHYRDHPPAHELALRDLAHAHQRLGVVRLKQGDGAAGRAALADALALVPAESLPLAVTLARWVDRGLQLNEERIVAEQRRRHYYTVRPGRVERGIALRLPELEGRNHRNGRSANVLV